MPAARCSERRRPDREAASAEEQSGFDIDPAVDAAVALPERPPFPVSLSDLDRVITDPGLMAQGTEIRPLRTPEYRLLASRIR